MRITYLLDTTPETDMAPGLFADALAARGHHVRIIAVERPAGFRGGRRAEWIDVDEWRDAPLSDEDVIIATSWDTARIAHGRNRRAIVQTPLAPPVDAPDIARLDLYCLVEDELYRDRAPRENHPLRVLLAGPSQIGERGIDSGYGAIAHARWFHQKVDLIRASPWAPSREEPLDTVQDFHVGLNGDEMRRLLHSCDILLAPAHVAAGFAQIAADAMAAGVPSLLTMKAPEADEPHDYALFGPERNAVELGERLIELVSDEELRDHIRFRGREVAELWRAETVVDRVMTILNEFASRP